MKMVGQIHNKTMSTDSTRKRNQIKSKCVLDEEEQKRINEKNRKTTKRKTENGWLDTQQNIYLKKNK